MKIALLSDIHGFLPDIDLSIDCVLLAGDICPDYRNINKQGTWLRMGFVPWINRFREKKFIGGNHDFYLDEYGFNHPDYLINSHAALSDGTSVYGLPYTICDGWAFHKTDEEIKNLLTFHKSADIMVCHSPPFAIGDRLAAGNIDAGGHIGSQWIRHYLDIVKPKLCIFGHCHEGYGVYHYNETLCINCAFTDEKRRNRMKYPVLDTKDMSIEIIPCKEWKE